MTNYSSSGRYISWEDAFYVGTHPVETGQSPYLTHKTTSHGPLSYQYNDKNDYMEYSTSNSLGSYNYMSPIKTNQSQHDLFEAFKRLADIAIQKKWSSHMLNMTWTRFVAAAKSLNAKLDLQDFFKDLLLKSKSKRSKSEPRKYAQKKDFNKQDRFSRPKQPILHHYLSQNHQTIYRTPIKTLVKSKSDLFKPKVDQTQASHKSKNIHTRQNKINRLCEQIEQGLARGQKIVISRTSLH